MLAAPGTFAFGAMAPPTDRGRVRAEGRQTSCGLAFGMRDERHMLQKEVCAWLYERET